MEVEVLISTMHQTDYSILDNIGLQSNAVVVNQCEKDSVEVFFYSDYKITWVNSSERGLSKSRNMAIQQSSADILLLVDDDEVLCPDYLQTVINGFIKYPDAAVIGFQVEGIEKKFKEYSTKEGKVGFLRSMKMSSVEIAFRRAALKNTSVMFNEKIGAGTKYMMGEENTVLFNLLSQKQKIYYIPLIIAKLHICKSTWFKGYNKEYMISRGAVFTAMSKQWSLILILQFAIRHKNLYIADMSILDACRYMLMGRKEYLSIR